MPPSEEPGLRLYAITDRRACAPEPLWSRVAELFAAGVRSVQVREKDLDEDELRIVTAELIERGRPLGARVLVNTSVRAAEAAGASGVHLPAGGPPVAEVRRQSSRPLLVGCSVHRLDEARQRQAEGADFLVCAPVFPTPGKPRYGPPLGPEGLGEVCRAVAVPVYALGGVTPDRVARCLAAGAHGVAVMSGLMAAADPRPRAERYLDEIARACGRS